MNFRFYKPAATRPSNRFYNAELLAALFPLLDELENKTNEMEAEWRKEKQGASSKAFAKANILTPLNANLKELISTFNSEEKKANEDDEIRAMIELAKKMYDSVHPCKGAYLNSKLLMHRNNNRKIARGAIIGGAATIAAAGAFTYSFTVVPTMMTVAGAGATGDQITKCVGLRSTRPQSWQIIDALNETLEAIKEHLELYLKQKNVNVRPSP